MTALDPVITPGDRLSFTTFLAIMIHAAIILGVTFTYIANKQSARTMEVTLAQHRSKNRPDKADFLAQFNQLGSGTLEEKALTTSPTRAEFHDTTIRETTPQHRLRTAPKNERQQKPVVTTRGKNDRTATVGARLKTPNPADVVDPNKKSLLERSLEIASLEARLDRQRQIYAKRPRIKRLTSLSTASSNDAFYLNSWRRKIEGIGNLNYPEQARRRKLYGSLRLMVAILPDGSLSEVALLETSGHRILDDAALRIVRLAAPFAPFPDDLRQTTDVLEIIRTWQFRKNSSLRSF
ncbi:MAG: energy transducer TonB [Gammaproteobacteria bacterium]|nr:energy transducer TonB [Gammaproteobacteria bacterium]